MPKDILDVMEIHGFGARADVAGGRAAPFLRWVHACAVHAGGFAGAFRLRPAGVETFIAAVPGPGGPARGIPDGYLRSLEHSRGAATARAMEEASSFMSSAFSGTDMSEARVAAGGCAADLVAGSFLPEFPGLPLPEIRDGRPGVPGHMADRIRGACGEGFAVSTAAGGDRAALYPAAAFAIGEAELIEGDGVMRLALGGMTIASARRWPGMAAGRLTAVGVPRP